MTSIFVRTLKKLIKEQLTPLSAREKNQSESRIYNQPLSLQQHDIIENLLDAIVIFDAEEPDESCIIKIISLIDKARLKVQDTRESFGEPKNEGEVVKCLTNLPHHVKDLHLKLFDLKKEHPELYSFDLLNVEYKRNPLHEVYSMVIYYFGKEIFAPNSNIDLKTRAAKEEELAKRVRGLSQRIKPDADLATQKQIALEVLADITKDNQQIVSQEKGMVHAVMSKFTFYGVGLATSFASAGRLGILLQSTNDTITSMSAEEFQPLVKPVVKITVPLPIVLEKETVAKTTVSVPIVPVKEENHESTFSTSP